VLKRGGWILLGGGLGVLLGGGAGHFLGKTTYTASVELVKKKSTSVFRSGRLGETYAPPVLMPATLIAAAASFDALQRVALRAKPPKTVAQLRNAYQLAEERKTDLLVLDVNGSDGAAETAALANIWAEELVNYTRDLQAGESRDIRTYLQQQLESMDKEITQIDREMVVLIEREGMVDAQKEIESSLRSLSGIELEFHNARISLQSLDAQIQALQGAIRKQNPAGARLRTQREQYEKLRSTYTESNPIVQEARAAMDQLEKEIESQNKDTSLSDDSFTGTGVGDALYIELIKLQNEKKGLTQRTQELEILLSEGKKEMRTIPEKAMSYQKLADRKTSLLSARELIAGRYQEARIFEERAPGYLGVLAACTEDEVVRHGRTVKTILFGVVGGVFFGGLSLAGLLVLEITSPHLRTKRELELILDLQAVAELPRPLTPEALETAWAAWMIPRFDRHQTHTAWTLLPFSGEDALWRDWMERGTKLFPSVIFVDLADTPLDLVHSFSRHAGPNQIPASGASVMTLPVSGLTLHGARQLAGTLTGWASAGALVLVRLAGPVREPSISMARALGPVVFFAALSSADRKEWRRQGEALRRTLASSHALLAFS
jgi:hypothetical protein